MREPAGAPSRADSPPAPGPSATSDGRLARRVRTIPVVFILYALVSALLPALLLLAAGHDLVRFVRRRHPWMATRLTLFGWLYLFTEVVGLIALFVTWIASGFGASQRRLRAWTAAVQRAWTAALLTWVRWIFQLRFEISGDAHVRPGPLLVFVKHSSMVDTLLPTNFITRRHGIGLRFVLKRELLVDPCLDVAGHWLPNHFVDRRATDSAAEIAAVRRLADDLGPDEGVLIYPEGTRFTRTKQAHALARLAESDPERHALAAGLRHVLPPRLGGALALLDGAPPADVLFVAHHGFEGFGSLAAIWRGKMVRRTIRVASWRVPRADVPDDRDARVRWLFTWWQRIDDWVDAARALDLDAATGPAEAGQRGAP